MIKTYNIFFWIQIFLMTIVEVAENIQKELDIEGVKSQKIRDLIS